MKSKIKLFLLPMLAIAIAATAFFGYANFNTPAKASATNGASPIFLYTGVTDQNINVWAWNGGTNCYDSWPGAEMSSLGHGWYGLNIDTSKTSVATVIFSIGGNKTGNIEYNPTVPVYKNVSFDSTGSSNAFTPGTIAELYEADSAFASEAQYNMFVANTWYLIGKIKGVANWTDSTYIKDAAGSNVAEWYNVKLYAGDEIKAVHGNDMPSLSQAKGRRAYDDSAFSSCDSDNGNLTVTYTGVYNVYLYDYYGTYYISIAPTVVQTTYYKTSTNTVDDGANRYLLLVTAFNLGACDGATEIGYDVTIGGDTATYYGTTYYSSISGSSTADIFGAGFSSFSLIVCEVKISTAAQDVTITAKVKNGESVLYSGLTATHSIPAYVAS